MINIIEVTYCEGYNIDIGGTSPPYAPASGGLPPYTYTWEQSVGCTGTWTEILNSNTSSYDPDQQMFQTTCFRRRVVDACGQSLYSNNNSGVKRINIVQDPTIVISGGGIFCVGDVVNLGSQLTDGVGPYNYVWQTGPSITGPWTVISGSNSDTYSPSTSTAGTFYYRIIADSYIVSCNQAEAAVEVTVNPIPNVSASPASQTLCSGSANSIALSGNVSGTTFTWTVVQTGTTGASNGSGSLISQTLSNGGSVPGTAVYTITPTANGCTGTPVDVTVTINPIPGITATPASQTFCSGSATSIALTSNVSGATFSWTVVQTGVTGASNGSGSSIVQTLSNGGLVPGTAVYTITPTANGCTGTPVDVTVTVNPIPDITATPASQTFCSGSATSIALTSNVSGATFTWTVVQTGVTGASNGSGSSIAQTLTNGGSVPGTAVYTITPTANGCAGTPIDVTVTINPIPDITATPASQTFCSGSATSIALTSNVSGATFTWAVVQTGVAGASPGSGSSIAQTLTNAGTVPGTAVYTITPTANGCTGIPIDVTVTVNPIPVVTANPASETFCSGSATTISLTSNVSNSTFIWTVVQTGVTGASNGSGSSIAQTLTNAGTVPGTAVYTITPSANGCTGTPVDVTVTVNPIPNVIANPVSQTFCSGSATLITLTSNVSGTTFTWTVIQTGVTGASNGSGSSIAQTLTTTGNIPGTATYTIIPSANGCNGIPLNITVTVNPTPTVTATPPTQTVCSGTTITQIDITNPNNVSGTTFSWTRTNTGVLTGIAGSGSGSSISGTLTNSTNSQQTTTFTITATAGSCTSSTTVSVIVNPAPTVSATNNNQTRCSGTAIANIVISNPNNVAGTTFSWTRDNTTNLTGIAASGTGTPISGTLTNTTNTQQTTIFTIIATSPAGCSRSTTATIVVNPVPTISATPPTQTVCSGTAITQIDITNPNNVSGTTFSWTRTNTRKSDRNCRKWKRLINLRHSDQ